MTADSLKRVEELKSQFHLEVETTDKALLPELKNKYLGRNGLVSAMLKSISEIPSEDRPQFGKILNVLKNEMTFKLEALLSSSAAEKAGDNLDYSLPARKYSAGTYHPLTLVMNEMCSLFERQGFAVVEGPEIETDYNNFTALNIPENHPARDMHDTFYLDAERLLRTQTSSVQIHVMENGTPPFRIIAPGKVFRKDSDITHSPMFHQVEGLCIGRDINFGHLKYVLSLFAKQMFDESSRVRFRPSYFPFTEPSAEVDISCMMCHGKGCRVCKNSGWIEILGAGMVNPSVFSNVGLDPEEYTGYAFGMGVERIAMLKYQVNDIRLFYENHLSFLKQFYAG